MQFYLQVAGFTTLGVIHLVATVRQDTPGGAIAPVLMRSIDVPDDGVSEPLEFLCDSLTWLLEDLSNEARHSL